MFVMGQLVTALGLCESPKHVTECVIFSYTIERWNGGRTMVMRTHPSPSSALVWHIPQRLTVLVFKVLSLQLQELPFMCPMHPHMTARLSSEMMWMKNLFNPTLTQDLSAVIPIA